MSWKPNRWLALALSLFLSPSGMLYVGKGRWAVFYLSLALLIGIGVFILLPVSEEAAALVGILNFAIVISSSIQTFIFANRYQSATIRPWYSYWYGITLIFLAIFIPIFLTRVFFFEPFRLPSASMEPSYTLRSHIIISKFGYGNYGAYGIPVYRTKISKPINHGDAIVFSYPHDPAIDYFKRVIGLPGDTIEYRSKTLWINGQPALQEHHSTLKRTDHALLINFDVFTETFGSASWQIQNQQGIPGIEFKTTVPAHMYFVMGDNRDNSNDSRFWGYVPERAIKGKVIHSF